jgi:Asp/Glu/hydantoin racemase
MNRPQRRKATKGTGIDNKVLSKIIDDSILKARKTAVRGYTVAMLSVLADKFDFDVENLQRAAKEVFERFDVIVKNYATLADYEKALKDEFDIEIAEK